MWLSSSSAEMASASSCGSLRSLNFMAPVARGSIARSIFRKHRPIHSQAEFARSFGGFAEHQTGFARDRDELESLFATARGGLPVDHVNARSNVVFARGFENVIHRVGESFVIRIKNRRQTHAVAQIVRSNENAVDSGHAHNFIRVFDGIDVF